MQVTIEIPDDMAQLLVAAGADPARAALEAVALEGYRAAQLSEYDVRRLLAFESRFQVWDLLAAHKVPRQYSLQDWEHDTRVADEDIARLRRERSETAPAR